MKILDWQMWKRMHTGIQMRIQALVQTCIQTLSLIKRVWSVQWLFILWGMVHVISIFFYMEAYAEGEEELKLYSRSAVLMDADTGRVLYESIGNEVFPMASTTKIMTCILALENGNLDDMVMVSEYAASQPDVQLNARAGESYRLEDLLYSLMLESHNDSAVAIAEHIGGSVKGFAELMNQKARELGCYDTYFVTPNGLDAVDEEVGKSHSTTAVDLAKIMRYCVMLSPKKEEFMEITRTQSRSFSDSKGSHTASCQNHNALLTMMDGVLSGKTGFTGKAGYCYVGAVEQDGKTLVLALLGCGWPPHKTYKWTDARKLLSYGFEQYQYQNLDTPQPWLSSSSAEHSLPMIEVEGGKTEQIGGKKEISVQVISEPFQMLMRADESIDLVWNVPKTLTAPVWAGTPVGTIEYQIQGVTWKTDSVVADETVELIDWKWCMEQVLKAYMLNS